MSHSFFGPGGCLPVDESYRRDIREVNLQKYRFEQQTRMDRTETIYRRGSLDLLENPIHRELIARLRMEVWGEKEQKRHVIRYPSDWWQAVKERFAPTWFRDRYPVRFTEIEASLRCIYPDFEPSIPADEFMPCIKVMVSEKFTYPTW